MRSGMLCEIVHQVLLVEKVPQQDSYIRILLGALKSFQLFVYLLPRNHTDPTVILSFLHSRVCVPVCLYVSTLPALPQSASMNFPIQSDLNMLLEL